MGFNSAFKGLNEVRCELNPVFKNSHLTHCSIMGLTQSDKY